MTPPTGLFAGFDFARDALTGTGAARGLLPGWISDMAATVARRAERPPPWTAAEVSELADFNRWFGHEAGARAAERLADPRTLAVVTGQQPNLLASPLYVLYKAASVVALARLWEERFDRPVVPVFWVASDDHDFAELRECHVLGAGDRIAALGGQVSRGSGVPADSPAFEWTLDDSSGRLMRVLEETLPAGPARAATLASAATALTPGATFESAFCRMLSSYFAGSGLVLLVPRLDVIRRRGAEVVRRDMASPGLLADALEARGAAMAAAGYSAPLQRSPDQVNSFHLKERVRRRLVRRGDGTISAERPSAPGGGDARHLAWWLVELARDPGAFSPNVVTRPVVQDVVLPSIAYVAGPGEMAYLAQLADVYTIYGVPQPLVLPRAGGVLLDAATVGGLGAAGLSAVDLLLPAEDLAAKAAGAHSVLSPLLAEAARLEEAVAATTDRMLATPAAAIPAVRVAISKTLSAQRRSLGILRRRLWRQGQMTDGGAWAALARGLACVRPLGRVQERVLSPLSFGGEVAPDRIGAAAVEMAGDWVRALDQPGSAAGAVPVRTIAAKQDSHQRWK